MGKDNRDVTKFLEDLKDILDEDIELTESTDLTELDNWDSASIINFLVFAQKEYGVKTITKEDINNVITVGDLYQLAIKDL